MGPESRELWQWEQDVGQRLKQTSSRHSRRLLSLNFCCSSEDNEHSTSLYSGKNGHCPLFWTGWVSSCIKKPTSDREKGHSAWLETTRVTRLLFVRLWRLDKKERVDHHASTNISNEGLLKWPQNEDELKCKIESLRMRIGESQTTVKFALAWPVTFLTVPTCS